MLTINLSERPPSTRILCLDGELDFFSAFQVCATLDECRAAGATILVVDVGDVGFVDASALGVLEKTWPRLRSLGVVVEMVNATERFHWVVSMVGLENTFQLAERRRPLLVPETSAQ